MRQISYLAACVCVSYRQYDTLSSSLDEFQDRSAGQRRLLECFETNLNLTQSLAILQVFDELRDLEIIFEREYYGPRFWAVPLINLVGEILPFRASVIPHPLRSGQAAIMDIATRELRANATHRSWYAGRTRLQSW
jgi:hypothetical protein